MAILDNNVKGKINRVKDKVAARLIERKSKKRGNPVKVITVNNGQNRQQRRHALKCSVCGSTDRVRRLTGCVGKALAYCGVCYTKTPPEFKAKHKLI